MEISISEFHFIEEGVLQYYINPELFTSEELFDVWSELVVERDQSALNFLEEKMGFFPPTDKIITINTLTTRRRGASASGFIVTVDLLEPYTPEQIEALSYGNTHEFTHVFLTEIPVVFSWFEEGLASYMQDLERGPINTFFCREDGWEEGYYDEDGNFRSNTGLVPYSDFTVDSETTAVVYDPLARSSYYRSAECFWISVAEIYGEEKMREIFKALHQTRITFPPQEQWLIRDVINPTLDADLSPLIYERYNYVEG